MLNVNVTNNNSNSLNYVMWYVDEGLDIDLGNKIIDSGKVHKYEVSVKNNSSSDNVTLSDSMVMVLQKELDV